MGKGQDKVFAVCIHHGKGQIIVMVFSMDSVLAKVQQGVVHPSHIPFEAETKAAQMGRRSDPCPGR